MQKITEQGQYDVTITDAMIEEKESNFKLLMKCERPDDYYIYHEMYFSSKIIGSGKHAGKSVWEANQQTLKSIGVKDGLLKNLRQAINDGLKARIVVENETYTDKNGVERTTLRSKWINPAGEAVSIDSVDFDKLMQDFCINSSPQQDNLGLSSTPF